MKVTIRAISGEVYKLDDTCSINDISISQTQSVSKLIYNLTSSYASNIYMLHFKTPEGDFLIPVTNISSIKIH